MANNNNKHKQYFKGVIKKSAAEKYVRQLIDETEGATENDYNFLMQCLPEYLEGDTFVAQCGGILVMRGVLISV